MLKQRRLFANQEQYLVNKPLQAAGISEDNDRGWRNVRKMNSWPRSQASKATVKFWGQFFIPGHYRPIYQQARKGFIYFITLRLISTTHALYCGKGKRDSEGVTAHLQLNKSKLVIVYSILLHCDYIWKGTSILVFFSSSIKSDDRYQIGRRVSPDTHRLILYHVMCFIQWTRVKINRWVLFYIFHILEDLRQPIRALDWWHRGRMT